MTTFTSIKVRKQNIQFIQITIFYFRINQSWISFYPTHLKTEIMFITIICWKKMVIKVIALVLNLLKL